MTRNIEQRLVSLSAEISALRDEVAILGEQLAFQTEVMDDSRVRALVAETPLADREFRIASDDFERIQRVLEETRARLAGLVDERDRLLSELLPEATSG
jgi:hypothetical protein